MTKDKIVCAAKNILDKDGLTGLTMRRVAQRAGLSPMALYRHFADKEALLNALMQDGLAAWQKLAASIVATDPVDWLEALAEAYLQFALTEPHRFDAAFFMPAPQARQIPDDFAAGRSPVVAMMLLRIEQAKSQGRLRDRPALELAVTLSALAQGLVSMYRANRFASEKEFKTAFRAQLRASLDAAKPAGARR